MGRPIPPSYSSMDEVWQAGDYRVVIYPYMALWWKARLYFSMSGRKAGITPAYGNKRDLIAEVERLTHTERREWVRLPSGDGH